MVRFQLAGLDDHFGLGDRHGSRGSHHRIEVLRGIPVDQVAVGVGRAGVNQGDVGLDGALLDIGLAVELRQRLAFGDEGAHAGLRVERRDAGAAGAQPLSKGALRGELHLQLAGEVLLGEELVFPNVGRDDLTDLAAFDQDPEALAVHAHVVGDDSQVLHPGVPHRLDQVSGDPAEPETADVERHAVAQYVLQSGLCPGFHL
ncbi:hypothetical protein SRABI128_05331 [Microbacterium sp. Bi128]|nr:hypothetical protein SRABI128_05331 [Microbacterium sp. Bi128]